VITIANSIRSGQIEIGIGGGVESMSLFSMDTSVDPSLLSPKVFDHPLARNCLMGMGSTSENVAEKYGISREK
jgi:acetyl-CoA acyltransferase 1